MALPIVPILKLIALGSVKIVLLGAGALFVPVFTARLVVGGTGESVKLAANWLLEHDKLSASDTEDFLRLLEKVQKTELEKSQARGLLVAMMRKTIESMAEGARNIPVLIAGLFRKN